MPCAPTFKQLQLGNSRPTSVEIVEFHDGEPLLIELVDTSPLSAGFYRLIIARSQEADTDPDRIRVLTPDDNLRFVVTPDLISQITDGLTYYFTLRSWHEVQDGVGAWFVRSLGTVRNKPANRNDDGAPIVSVDAAVAAGALADQTYTQGTGDQTVDASSDFTGAVGGSWSVSGAGATIDSSGLVTIPTHTLRSAATVTVTYTNAGGAASSAFSVTVEAAASQPGIVYGTDSYTVENGDQVTVSGLSAPYDGTYDLPESESPPSYLVEPFRTGASGAGNVQTVNQGIAYGGDGGLTCTITLKRGGVAFVTDAAFDLDHATDYTYTELETDPDNGGVTAEVTLDDGTAQTTVTLTIVAPVQAAVVSSAPAGATTTSAGDLLGDGRTWTLYDVPHDGSGADLTGSFEFSQVGQVYAALVGGGSGGSSRQYSTAESDFGGEGGPAGEVLDFAEISVSASEDFTIGKGGAGAQPNVGLNQRGGTGNDTTFAGLTARGANESTDGSGTYSNGATPSGLSAKGGGAGAGGDGQQAPSNDQAGAGGVGKTISFGSLSRTYGFGGGGSSRTHTDTSDGGAGGDPSNPADGAGQNYGSAFTAAADGAQGTGSGGGGAANWNSEPLAAAGDGAGGRLLLLVETS